ncbi:MAG: hypothetical protein AB1714_10360 [Acidobacteriota bacterium]
MRPVKSHRRLSILLVLLAGAVTLALTKSPVTSPPPSAPAKPARLSAAHAMKPVVVVMKIPELAADAPADRPWRRNPFTYADLPVMPELPSEQLPPPPPPEIQVESRFIGTIDRDGMQALFLLKSDVLTLREGDMLEHKFVVKSIEPEAVLIEEPGTQLTKRLALERK